MNEPIPPIQAADMFSEQNLEATWIFYKDDNDCYWFRHLESNKLCYTYSKWTEDPKDEILVRDSTTGDYSRIDPKDIRFANDREVCRPGSELPPATERPVSGYRHVVPQQFDRVHSTGRSTSRIQRWAKL
jgi:hypothetical protein